MTEMIRCAASPCQVLRPADQFISKVTSKRTKLCQQCRDHHSKSMRLRKQKWWPKRQAYNRLITYGLSDEDYGALYKAQKGKCKICQKEPTDTKGLCVDHNHDTKEVRGLLCSKCNLALGHFNDDPETLLRAVQYLQGGFRDPIDL